MREKILAGVGEKWLLRRLNRWLGRGVKIVRTFSEDCAVIEAGGAGYLLYTVDALVEGVHFKQEYTTPYLIGRKALKVNVSDISAMGGHPLYYLISTGVPPQTRVSVIDELYRGMASVAKELDIRLLGGNVTAAPLLFLDIFLVGEVSKRNAIFRDGARVGDSLFVSGVLGAAAEGLRLLQCGYRADSRRVHVRQAIRAHLDPPCLSEFSREISSWGCVTSMIDLSDGLAADLAEICRESGVGAVVQKETIPVANSVLWLARRTDQDPYEPALSGGEDYELLFTVAPKKRRTFLKRISQAGYHVFEIGKIVNKAFGLKVVDERGRQSKLRGGFDHFRSQISD